MRGTRGAAPWCWLGMLQPAGQAVSTNPMSELKEYLGEVCETSSDTNPSFNQKAVQAFPSFPPVPVTGEQVRSQVEAEKAAENLLSSSTPAIKGNFKRARPSSSKILMATKKQLI